MRDKTKNKIMLSGMTIIIFIGLFVFFSLLFNYPDKIETLKNTVMIENYVKSNNLNMPLPNWIHINGEEDIINLFNLDLIDFHNQIKLNYVYSDAYDCKYWAYVWSNYYKFNQDKYNLKLIATDTHIFTILYNDSMYCLADQDILNCVNQN